MSENMRYLVDAIIPTLNAELHLDKCLKSIRNMKESELVNVVIIA